jgi:hypothetical protein
MSHFLSPNLVHFPDGPLPHNIQYICQYCKAIAFEDLPSEDEPGFPHQPSLDALKKSAVRCPLCALILGAASEVRKRVDFRYKGGTSGLVAWDPTMQLPDGRPTMAHFQLGDYIIGSELYLKGPASTDPDKPGYPFDDDLSVRPWLFGNWWKLRDSNAPPQLVGLGVRLARKPNIEDAEGNGAEVQHYNANSRVELYYHGSFLRIRTEDSMIQPPLC